MMRNQQVRGMAVRTGFRAGAKGARSGGAADDCYSQYEQCTMATPESAMTKCQARLSCCTMQSDKNACQNAGYPYGLQAQV